MTDQISNYLSQVPSYGELAEDQRSQLEAMAQNMVERELPPAVILAGLRSTSRLLVEQKAEREPRMTSDLVQEFLDANRGIPVARSSRAIPRKETKQRARERLYQQLVQTLRAAHSAKRIHEVKKLRRDLLAVDQAYVRRNLGEEGDALCREINQWLIDAASRINR
jgi:hypothetical protein